MKPTGGPGLALAAITLGAFVASACSTLPATSGSPGSSPAGTPASVPGAPDHPTGSTREATLVRVVDGDTIRVMVEGVEERVRYIGMDTPELNESLKATPEPYAEAATTANAKLLAGADRLVLERDISERDRYGRLLADVWVERDGTWTFVDLELVAQGFAQVATFPPDVRYVDVLLTAEREARLAGRGLWGSRGGE
jgi:micrococcal nuclease